MAGTTERGFCDPAPLLKAIIVVGSRLAAAVFITARVIISRDASSFFPPLLMLSLCNFFIASSARGVAAFPIPKRFAAMQAEISSAPSPLFAASGKNSFIMGEISFDSTLIAPALRKTSIIPHQRHITPQRDMVS